MNSLYNDGFCRSIAFVLALLVSMIGTTDTFAAGAAHVYVVHQATNAVSAIDTASGSVVATVPVGSAPTAIAVTRDGTRAYVANTGSDSVSIVDTALQVVVETISVGDSPTALAVTPDGARLYVMTAGGVVQVIGTHDRVAVATIHVGTSGGLAMTPDGTRVYVAAGLIHVVDTATHAVVNSFPAEWPGPDVTTTATGVTLTPDGRRAYVNVVSYAGGFFPSGSLAVVDTASETVVQKVDLGSLLGSVALTPDGSRAYVGIQSTFVNTGYGAGFFPGSHVVVLDAIDNSRVATIRLGADGPNWTQQNTAAGIAVAPDRSALYVAIPRLNSVAVASVNTNLVTALIPVTPSPGSVAVVSAGETELVPYAIDAADDSGTVSTAGGLAVRNVLANDRIGGIAATLARVTIATRSSTSDGVTLDAATGDVTVAEGTAIGVHTLAYRICEIASPANCGDAEATVTVREIYVIDAVDDSAVTLPGRSALASVLANDALAGAPATVTRVALTRVSATSDGILLNLNTGSVFVTVGTQPGPQTLTYRICEIASPLNCDEADVILTVTPFPIDARDDSGAAPHTGGMAVGNVLANDTFNSAVATLAKVRVSQVTSTHAGVSLNALTGAVTVAAGTPVGNYALRYRICEIATPSNCDEADVAVSVQPILIRAVNDSGRGSSKVANIVVANVLANDRLGSAAATVANVRLAQVSVAPANSRIRLDVADGSVDVLGKTDSGRYALVYEICERAMLTNCARATVTIDLSGGN